MTNKVIQLSSWTSGHPYKRRGSLFACVVLFSGYGWSGAEAQPTASVMPVVADVTYIETINAPDGSQRSLSTSGKILRDRQGRMRIDWGHRALIADPVRRLYFDLDMDQQTVRQREMIGSATASSRVPQREWMPEARPAAHREVTPLGSRMIEGLICEGKRFTQFVPTDASDPDEGFTVETELWTSVELQIPVLVTSSSSTGRHTHYALSNIRTDVPSPEQFLPPEEFEDVTGNGVTLESFAVPSDTAGALR